MNIHYCKLLGLLAAGLTIVTPAFGAPLKPEKVDSAKTTTIDLRPRMKQMKLKDGSNLVDAGSGYKLYAVAQGGKVTQWKATDDSGKSLPIKRKGYGTLCVCCYIRLDGTCGCLTCFSVPRAESETYR